MSNFSASIPVDLMQAANEELELLGHGPGNFTVPAYAGPTPSFAMMHGWGDEVFEAHVTALFGVTIQQAVVTPIPDEPDAVNEDPIAITNALASSLGTDWTGDAQPLDGIVTPGLDRDDLNVLWYVIQTYDTSIYPDPASIPALVRRAKIPGEALPWIQPIDQFDAYLLVNPFTGVGDLCTDQGSTWQVTQADGSGSNVWQPGVFGWTVVGQVPLDYVTYNTDPVFFNGQGLTNG